ncbi:uncharacterized protein LOC108109804 [Drosophila eugracilis]|uniref:uncharacterized protein LOC108109804 n=1 Tax=Drosophila eugracilis TaxID=29029 RepID=UPI001BDAD229|nr:uncharacterized protein LOC108109804 [Drosophila eugracilis]
MLFNCQKKENWIHSIRNNIMKVQGATSEEPSGQGSSSASDVEVENDGKFLKVAPLLKPVANNIYSGFGLNWYMIFVRRCGPDIARFFVNLTQAQSLVCDIYANTKRYIHLASKWTTILLMTTSQSFWRYRDRFSMTSIFKKRSKRKRLAAPIPPKKKQLKKEKKKERKDKHGSVKQN